MLSAWMCGVCPHIQGTVMNFYTIGRVQMFFGNSMPPVDREKGFCFRHPSAPFLGQPESKRVFPGALFIFYKNTHDPCQKSELLFQGVRDIIKYMY